jgi:lycopene cyclase CruP
MVNSVSLNKTREILGRIPGGLAALERTDGAWVGLRGGKTVVPKMVQVAPVDLGAVDWDVVICGGTLGIILGLALVKSGRRVVLLERGRLLGRSQEWNISRGELMGLVRLGLVDEAELEAVISSEFNPVRVGFTGGEPLWVRDVLNVGVSPEGLLHCLKEKFLAQGGVLKEHYGVEAVVVHPDGVCVNGEVTGRLLLDGMGHFSPISQQARAGRKPEGVCLVVGTCAEGFPENQSGDLIYSFTPILNQCQYFWEAFPAKDGRTTYLFTYVDAHPDRLALADLFEEYFRLLPEYQGVPLENLVFKRSLCGFFPCYQDSPLVPMWDRILAVGDSSGLQSPLSFGGFGAMMRHLERLVRGIEGALVSDCLGRGDLAQIQSYMPGLSVTWLFQKTMSVPMGQRVNPDQINGLLREVFGAMAGLGDPVLRPFLQDVVRFGGLSQTLWAATLRDPALVIKLLPQVGVGTLADWLGHYLSLGSYGALHRLAPALKGLVEASDAGNRYRWQCRFDAWKYGSGNDYENYGE